MSTNNSSLKGVLGSKYQTVGKTEDPKPAEDPSQRRRSSSGMKFNGLMNQKRDSTDAAAAARKASFAEQNKAPGVFGGLWQRSQLHCGPRVNKALLTACYSFTKGSGSK
ncbi:MAG: hypothetical protein Q9212_000315 [Teloschistes hypoglaucus]